MKPPIKMTLCEEEMRTVARAGADRQVLAIAMNRPSPIGESKEPWRSNIEGCATELVVSLWTGLHWTAVKRNIKDIPADVGQNVEVRWTPNMSGGLIVHKHDAPNKPYVLVRGEMPCYEIVGWAFGCEAQKDEYWQNKWDRPCYLYPAVNLRCHSTLSGVMR